jgi:hypothetical protein
VPVLEFLTKPLAFVTTRPFAPTRYVVPVSLDLLSVPAFRPVVVDVAVSWGVLLACRVECCHKCHKLTPFLARIWGSLDSGRRTYVRNWRGPCQATKSRLTTDLRAVTMAIIGRHHPGATCSREVHLCASGSFRHSSRWLCSSRPRPLSWLIAPDRTSDRPRALDWLYTACGVVN